ncbi:MAG: hypothetical protein V1650_02670 [Candidatus Omnitrophota bacterium]
MIKNHKITLIIALLCGITLVSIFKYGVALRENSGLNKELAQTKQQVVALEQEKQNLLQSIEKEKSAQKKLSRENIALKDYLKASKQRLVKLFKVYAKERQDLQTLDSKYGFIKLENKFLIKNRKQLIVENKIFQAKSGSVEELRKAIREISAQMYGASFEGIQGNRGYVIKDGKPTSATKVKIAVDPAPKN